MIGFPKMKSSEIHHHCHCGVYEDISNLDRIALVGNPNVGKSVTFNILTGKYVTVSNYPGTTVDISTGKTMIEGKEFGVIDTPGMYSLLLPITEEEEISRKILLEEKPEIVVHIVDAKNLERMLPLTLQLIEADMNVILVLNLMDEAQRYGVSVNVEELSRILGIPVIDTIAIERKNIDKLKRAIVNYKKAEPKVLVRQEEEIEKAIEEIIALSECSRIEAILALISPDQFAKSEAVKEIVNKLSCADETPLSYSIISRYYEVASDITEKVVEKTRAKEETFGEKLSTLTMNPITGLPIFLLVLYGFYLFVGVFGAQTLVDFIEVSITRNPTVNAIIPIVSFFPLFSSNLSQYFSHIKHPILKYFLEKLARIIKEVEAINTIAKSNITISETSEW